MKQIKEFIKQNTINNCVLLTDEQLFNLSDKEINIIVNEFGGKYMIKLPKTEIIFFDWLQKIDPSVWNDIWNDNEDSDADLYTVSITFLPNIVDNTGRGFPICDLLNNDNYYFHIDQMIDEESKIIIDSAKELFKRNQKVTIAQLLAIEISIAPIDIWHFTYKHKLNLNDAKTAVRELVEDNAIVHLTDAEHLIPFLPF